MYKTGSEHDSNMIDTKLYTLYKVPLFFGKFFTNTICFLCKKTGLALGIPVLRNM